MRSANLSNSTNLPLSVAQVRILEKRASVVDLVDYYESLHVASAKLVTTSSKGV